MYAVALNKFVISLNIVVFIPLNILAHSEAIWSNAPLPPNIAPLPLSNTPLLSDIPKSRDCPKRRGFSIVQFSGTSNHQNHIIHWVSRQSAGCIRFIGVTSAIFWPQEHTYSNCQQASFQNLSSFQKQRVTYFKSVYNQTLPPSMPSMSEDLKYFFPL